MAVKVRRANSGDVPWLLEELKKFAAFFDSRVSLYDEQTAPKIVDNFVETRVLFIAEKEDKRAGFIGGDIFPHFLNPNIRVFGELVYWVAEDFRGSRAGLVLLDEFIAFGRAAGCDWITIAKESKSQMNERCLAKRGFVHQESAYLLEVA